METLKLEASYRSDMSKRRRKALRLEGYVTGSVFGRGVDPVSVEVKLEDLVGQIKQAEAGVKSLIDLKINGAPNASGGIVIVKEFFKDPLTRKVLDLQLQRVNLKEKINVGVPIEMIGEAPGASEGGILEQSMDELQINCLPTEIPPRIEVDVTALEVGMLIRVEDLKLEGDVEILADPDAVVCNCRPPLVIEEPEEEVVEEEEGVEGEEEIEGEGEAPEAEAEAPESEE